jgi:hypothetical protein
VTDAKQGEPLAWAIVNPDGSHSIAIAIRPGDKVVPLYPPSPAREAHPVSAALTAVVVALRLRLEKLVEACDGMIARDNEQNRQVLRAALASARDALEGEAMRVTKEIREDAKRIVSEHSQASLEDFLAQVLQRAEDLSRENRKLKAAVRRAGGEKEAE